MKIVMFCEFFDPSLSYQDNLVAEQYVHLGHEVTVVSSTFTSVFDFMAGRYDKKSGRSVTHAGGVKIVRLPYRIFIKNKVRYLKGVPDLLLSEDPDLIYFHEISLNLVDAAGYIARFPKKKMILDSHMDYSNSGANWLSRVVLHGFLRRGALRYARPYISRIFPVTPACSVFLHELYSVPYHEMELLPLGTDLALAGEIKKSDARQRHRARYGIGQEDFVVFSGGKFDPRKRTELLIEAFRTSDLGSDWLVIVGESGQDHIEYAGTLRSSAANHPRIIFTGWLDTRALLEHLAMSDIAAFPASQSVLWQHAIGMDKPIVIGDSRARKGGVQDFSYLNLYDNLLISDQEHVTSEWLADTLLHLKRSPKLRAKMADGARRVAEEQLDWSRTIKRTLRFNLA